MLKISSTKGFYSLRRKFRWIFVIGKTHTIQLKVGLITLVSTAEF